jgi:hypothetical protein
MIELFNPGIGFYAQEIESGQPFAFVRYGEGEWKCLLDELPTKRRRTIWGSEEVKNRLRETLINCHHDDRYWVAGWHWRHLRIELKKLPVVLQWIDDNVPDWVQWHDGRVWRRSVEQGKLFPLMRALRSSPLPLVVIGPKRIGKLGQMAKLRVVRHITTRSDHCFVDYDNIKQWVELAPRPAIYSFSCGFVAKMLIHQLWPEFKEDGCYMIDFGALWEGVCGLITRPFHRKVSKRRWYRNLWGK